jgi:N-acetylmuramoyl-L-alanine amidase/putative methionine-R-sulfoxide reductase with GAF domain
MNASPYNTLGDLEPAPSPAPGQPRAGKNEPPQRDALQALLAFAALQQQIRSQKKLAHPDSAVEQKGQSREERFALDEVLQLVAERALAITHADGVAIALAEEGAIVCRAVAGTITPDKGAKVNPNYGFSGACLSSGSTVRCDDAQIDARVNPDICRKLGTRSMVGVPLWAKQTVIGIIEAFASDAKRFTESDVRRLNLLAELLLAALQPEEEDRMAEISRRVVRRPAPVEPIRRQPVKPAPAVLPLLSNLERTGKIEILPKEPARRIPAVHLEAEEGSRRGLWIGLGVIAAALAIAGVWWNIHNRHVAQADSFPQQSLSASAPAANASIATSTKPGPASDETSEAPAPRDASGVQIITGIRHWSSPDSSTVVIDLQDQVQYEAHRLSDPERIYFDLHDTKLDPKLNRSEEIGDPLLLRLRAAELSPGVTRVVLETKPNTNFSVSLEQNPYRLVVEVRSVNSKPQARTKVDLFGPSNPPIAPDAAAASAATQINPAKTPVGAAKFRLVLDAGHGGWDLGTVGRRGLLEKDLVLDIVGRLGKLVQNRLGADVVYTRTDDVYVPLEKRTEIANLAKGDLFLSVHANYSDYSSARGVETYYTNTYSSVHARTADVAGGSAPLDISWTNVNIREKVEDSKRFAADIQQSLFHTVTAKSAVPNRGVKEASYVVLTGATMPAVLTEVSFVSSPTDETNLESSTYRQQLAEALYQGIAKYVESTRRVSVASATPKPATH